ncbi:MAG TPA: ribosome maturation factor RimP [Thermoanaerobaculia bacterium]|jgi:ribosome maturation factor RimP|nr:ribosome maturation factor RimP [Thermoanaerobaculia bacterium]
MKTPLGDKTTSEIGAIAVEKGCRLLAIETAGAGRFTVLRLVLERADGSAATVDDCEAVSREASAVLDAADEIAHRYTLEVSSAGLDRKLYTLDDARRFVGRRVRVKTEEPVVPEPRPTESGKTPALSPARNFAGRLESIDGDRLTVVDELEHKTYNVRFGDIRLARLDVEWPRREGPGR